MKLANWNVNAQNNKLASGLEHIKSLEADIITLQEFPRHRLSQVKKTFPEYHMNLGLDFKSNVNKEYDLLLVTLTKMNPQQIRFIKYTEDVPSSFLKKYVYHVLRKQKEKFTALVVEVDKDVLIVNVHLPTACGVTQRMQYLEKILLELKKYKHVVLAGDLNVSSGKFFNLISGWARGFSRQDYQLNEREIADNLLAGYNFFNAFQGKNTTVIPNIFGRTQFDHILVKGFAIKQEQIFDNFGSDHMILAAEI